MNVPDVLKRISERLQSSGTVTTVYGEPIVGEGRTIVPVARARYGFGAGGGTIQAHPDAGDGEPANEGGGGGGGVEVTPIGVLEITATETRFISFEDRRRVIRAPLIGSVLAFILLRRRRG